MSRFYRTSSASDSGSPSPSMSGEDEVNELDQAQSNDSDGAVDITTTLNSLGLPGQPSNSRLHRDILLHTLLEERCLNEVRKEQRGMDDSAIRAEARRRYQHLSAQLASHDLVPPGLDHDRMAATRQQYRQGLNMLSRNAASLNQDERSLPTLSKRLLADSGDNSPQPLQLTRQLSDASSVFDSLAMSHPLLKLSRYRREFQEMGVLGKGGYGTVFRVKHRLDGSDYAVKRVPVSAARLARIKSRGQTELDDLLRELRTMAKLDHPNVVRYHAGWIEWSHVNGHSHSSDILLSDARQADVSYMSSEGDAVPKAQDSMASLRRVVTQSDTESAGIVFEDSLSQEQPSAQASAGIFDAPQDTSNMSDSDANGLVRTTEPTLALHLQMGLYPLTLAEFISPPLNSDATPLAHCFHFGPSIDILLALLDGVEYLHSEGVVHRDLKPANVFLAANNNPRRGNSSGPVDLFLCRACRASHQAQPVTLAVRIGDFGLVTALAWPETPAGRNTSAVGTEIYRPLHPVSNASASLDVYALGIIAFELLWRFGTRMERHEKLQRLKQGQFPPDFSSHVGDPSGRIEDCVAGMLSGGDTSVTIPDLRKRLIAIRESQS